MNQDNEKIFIYVVIGFFAVAFILTLYMIWKPSSDNIKAELNIINVDEKYEDVQLNNYSTLLNELLNIKNYEKLYEKVDKDWLENNSYTKDSLYDYLFTQGIIINDTPVIKESIVLSGYNEDYFYRFGLQNEKGNIRYLIIHETTPNVYTVSFDQNSISNLEGKTYTYVEDGIKYELKTLASLENVVQYELTISSTREDEISFDFTNTNCVAIQLKNGTKYNPIDITTATDNIYKVGENSKFSIKLTFNLSLEKQADISKICLYYVYDSKGSKIINVDLLGGEE